MVDVDCAALATITSQVTFLIPTSRQLQNPIHFIELSTLYPI